MAMASLSLSLLLFLSASLTVGAQKLPVRDVSAEEACVNTPHPQYCAELLKGAASLAHAPATAYDMAQYSMGKAASVGAEASTLARAAQEKLPKRGKPSKCMEQCLAGFNESVSHLSEVDPKLLRVDHDKFKAVYSYIQSSKGAIDENVSRFCNGCQATPATDELGAKLKDFSMLVDLIISLAKQTKWSLGTS